MTSNSAQSVYSQGMNVYVRPSPKSMNTDDAVLYLNTAIAHAKKPVLMAEAMRDGVIAGRKAFLAGRMPKRLYANASSPEAGLIE